MPNELPFTADDATEAANTIRAQTRQHESWRRLADLLDKIGGIADGERQAVIRRDFAKSQQADAEASVSNAQQAAAKTVADAQAEAAVILNKAKNDADAIARKAREDLQTELAETNATLEAARHELSGLNDRVAKARDALSA